jgi:spore coat polysaccharide biosynthesis protein SpsF
MKLKKIGIISQARMTSTRLPGKVLLEAAGKSMLEYHTERLASSGLPIIIATTTNDTDDPIVDFAKGRNISYYRGDENHVLSRYYEAAKSYELDTIIRVTSDCPLIDGNLVREGVDLFEKENNQYLYLSNCLKRSYPRGFDFEVFSFQALKEAYHCASLPGDIEHVTPYIHQNRSEKVVFRNITQLVDKSEYRITLDTEEDFQLIKILIEQYGAAELDFMQIISVFDSHPELASINAHIEQKKF